MNLDEIIKLAREAGDADEVDAWQNVWTLTQEELERFAALVAAAEREACAKACDELPMYGPDDETADWYGFAQADCAAAIRARGEK